LHFPDPASKYPGNAVPVVVTVCEDDGQAELIVPKQYLKRAKQVAHVGSDLRWAALAGVGLALGVGAGGLGLVRRRLPGTLWGMLVLVGVLTALGVSQVGISAPLPVCLPSVRLEEVTFLIGTDEAPDSPVRLVLPRKVLADLGRK